MSADILVSNRNEKFCQKSFLNYSERFATVNKINFLLGGSFAKGTATPFSDIDLYMFTGDKAALNKFIYGYGKPVYISQTINPKGIIIVIYENGIAVDLEIMKGEISISDYFSLKPQDYNTAEIDSEIADSIVICKDHLYSMSRLFHRSLIKYLSGKQEAGVSVLSEIADELQLVYDHNKTYKQNYQRISDRFEQIYSLDEGYRTVLNNLANQL